MIKSAYAEGRYAFRHGKRRDACPYAYNSERGESWRLGFNEAKAKHKAQQAEKARKQAEKEKAQAERKAWRDANRQKSCSVCCDYFHPSDMDGKKCKVCAQAPYLTNNPYPDERERWGFNVHADGFNAFLSGRAA